MIFLQSSRDGSNPCHTRDRGAPCSLVLEIRDDLGQTEHAHGDDDEANAVGKLREPEAVACHT